jgi:hypothetical protein
MHQPFIALKHLVLAYLVLGIVVGGTVMIIERVKRNK